MENVILVLHLFLALAIIGLVLLQRSEGGGLGIGGGGGGLGGLASAQGTASFMTRLTWFCAIAFFCTSLILGILAAQHSRERASLAEALQGIQAPIDGAPINASDETSPGDEPLLETPEEPPSVPIKE